MNYHSGALDERARQKILVMGGLGFIGSNLSHLLLREGYSLRIFDKLYGSRLRIKDIEHRVEVVEGDAKKPQDVINALENIDVVIDLVHTTVPGTSMQDPVYDVETNVASHVGWLSLLHKTAVRRLIYVSSGGTVYGVPKRNPICEDDPTDPVCSYGITKLAIEKYVALYAHMQGIDYRICRPANAYGENQHIHVGQGAIGVFLDRCIKKQSITVWGDGSAIRDYLYVGDMVEGIIALVPHQGDGRIFNISSCKGNSLNDIIAVIRDDLAIPVKVNYKESRRFDVDANVLDNSRLQRETGWRMKTDLVSGMRRVYDHLIRIGQR